MAWISFLIKDVTAVVALNQPVMTATVAMVFHSAKKTQVVAIPDKAFLKRRSDANCNWGMVLLLALNSRIFYSICAHQGAAIKETGDNSYYSNRPRCIVSNGTGVVTVETLIS